MTTTEQTKRVVSRELPNGDYIVATLELSNVGNGYFSATVEGWEKRGNRSGRSWAKQKPDDCHFGGADTDLIARLWPQYEPFVRMHLSDLDGVPMHAEANGWYWYASYDGQGTHTRHEDDRTDYQVACKYLRVDAIPEGLTRAEFGEFVDAQRDRWKREAAEAIDLIK